MAEPRVSVIMPAFNRSALIGAAIDSVLAQTMAAFELIVVDDGSSDGTAAVVKGVDDRRVRLIALPKNGGSNRARNAGIAAARAGLIAFLDSDDTYLPDRLDRLVERFDDDPGMDVLVDSFARLSSPSARQWFKLSINPDGASNAQFRSDLFGRKLHKATSAIVLRAEAARQAGGFDPQIRQRQDFEFLIRLSERFECRSTSAIGWIKGWTEQRITSRERFFAAAVALVERHPAYLAETDYRAGLARDLVRNGLMLVRRGRWRLALADVGLSARSFGPWMTARLLASGTAQAVAALVRPKRSTGASPMISPAVRSALEAARSRGSPR